MDPVLPRDTDDLSRQYDSHFGISVFTCHVQCRPLGVMPNVTLKVFWPCRTSVDVS
jgi:hypothetical protein